jgi:RNA polymerase sigma factor (TIGR02999 family)
MNPGKSHVNEGSAVSEVTQILGQIEGGDGHAAEKLLPLVYDELRRLAAAKMAHEQPGQTLQATALVHEAYIRLVDVKKAQHWDSRGHFFSAAAEAMRRILVENARRKNGPRHGGGCMRQELDEAAIAASQESERLLDLDEALTKLSQQDAKIAELVQLRYFAGCTMRQAAEILGISARTADHYWSYAKAWLREEISNECT